MLINLRIIRRGFGLTAHGFQGGQHSRVPNFPLDERLAHLQPDAPGRMFQPSQKFRDDLQASAVPRLQAGDLDHHVQRIGQGSQEGVIHRRSADRHQRDGTTQANSRIRAVFQDVRKGCGMPLHIDGGT